MPIEALEVLEPAAACQATASLSDRIRVRLKCGYEVLGTRLDVLSRFIEPYLKEGLRSLRARFPSVDELREVEIGAYLAAHRRRPEILAGQERELVPALEARLRDARGHWSVLQDMLRGIEPARSDGDPAGA
jgi:hypothetical protein